MNGVVVNRAVAGRPLSSSTRAAWLLPSVALGAWVLAYALAFAPPPGQPSLPAAYLVYGVPYLAFAAVGGLIIGHRKASRVGWILCGIGVGQGVATASGQLVRHLATSPATGELARWLVVVMAPAGIVSTVLIVVLLVVFPDGRLPSPRWRWFVAVIGVLTGAVTAYQVTTPDPESSIPGLPSSPLVNPAVAAVLAPVSSFSLFPAAVLVAAVALVIRYRSGTLVVRRQIKWLTLAAVVLAGSEVANIALGSDVLSGFFDAAGKLAVTAAIGVAVLRHRLLDVDLVISRALAYGWLAALVTGIYVALVVGIGSLAGYPTGPELLLSLVATIVVALVSLPLRSRLQEGANRLVYGRRQAPYESLTGFTRRLGDRYAIGDVLPDIASALGEGLRARSVAIYLHKDGATELATTWPDAVSVPDTEPGGSAEIGHQGQGLGRLAVWTPADEQLNDTERRLLTDLAGQAGLVLHNARLAEELQRRLTELQASRLRLVTAQDAERRRLERDLHDGAQQDLVTLRMKLGHAERIAADAGPQVIALLAEVREHTAATLESIRRLSRGIYPPLLQSQGLCPALVAHARRLPVPVEVRGGEQRFAREIETAVYFCCVEALQNTVKHAHAGRAWLAIDCRDGLLRFEVGDDGRGFDPARAEQGCGLQNIADRLEALGGRVHVWTSIAGTRIEGTVPLTNTPAANRDDRRALLT